MMNKGKNQSYGSYILDNKEEILKRKKRIIRAKRGSIFLIILIAVLITLCLTLPIFNIKTISIKGNSMVSTEEIESIIGVSRGSNIFNFRKGSIVDKLRSNPYIYDVDVKREFPNKLAVNVDERKLAFYIPSEEGYNIIDEEGIYLENRESIEGIPLVKLEGITLDKSLEAGKPIIEEENNLKAITTIYKFLTVNNLFEKYNVTTIQPNDFIDMKLYINDFYVVLGTRDDLFDKLSKAFNIIESSGLSELKGYLDVSFDGNPVIYRNPEKE